MHSEADYEDDEEANEWELAQIRRSGRLEEELPREKPKTKTQYKAAPSEFCHPPKLPSNDSVPTARTVPTISSAQARLVHASSKLEDTQAYQVQSLEAAVGELSTLERSEKELREAVRLVEGKREWVEEFRGWVEMLGGFLEEKVCHQTVCYSVADRGAVSQTGGH